jgi:hypothetical protein
MYMATVAVAGVPLKSDDIAVILEDRVFLSIDPAAAAAKPKAFVCVFERYDI